MLENLILIWLTLKIFLENTRKFWQILYNFFKVLPLLKKSALIDVFPVVELILIVKALAGTVVPVPTLV